MKLKKIIKNLKCETVGELNVDINDITYNSKEVVAGSIFVCLVGENSDGHNFAKEAEKNGATAIICEKKVDVSITQVIVENSRKALSTICSNFNGNPETKLKMVAITGTNGKTTTSFLIKSILESADKKVGLIGTEGVFYGKQYIKTNLTTPDPTVLFKTFKEMVDSGIEYVAIEVSAHALFHNKTEGIVFDVGVFTNLTQDHLDFFGTMENYGKTKEKLFQAGKIKSAVLNFDDLFGVSLGEKIVVPFVSYGIKNPSDVFAINIEQKNGKTKYFVNLLDNVFEVESNLLGKFNVYNSLAAASATALLGIEEEQIKKGLENLISVPGRFTSFFLANGATAVIDFAHTPDGFEQILKTLKSMDFNKIITVFGCSGNKDKAKRPIMGKIAEKYSDYVVLTTDNPCYENPNLIISDIEHGMKKNEHTSFVDRKEAIRHAISLSSKNTVVAILGKGTETFQDVNGFKVPHCDFDVAQAIDEEMQIESLLKGRI